MNLIFQTTNQPPDCAERWWELSTSKGCTTQQQHPTFWQPSGGDSFRKLHKTWKAKTTSCNYPHWKTILINNDIITTPSTLKLLLKSFAFPSFLSLFPNTLILYFKLSYYQPDFSGVCCVLCQILLLLLGLLTLLYAQQLQPQRPHIVPLKYSGSVLHLYKADLCDIAKI